MRGLRERYSSIISHGYGGIAAELVAAGLVDEVHVGIHPYIVGEARIRLTTPELVGLRLLDAQTSESGIIAARYGPVG